MEKLLFLLLCIITLECGAAPGKDNGKHNGWYKNGKAEQDLPEPPGDPDIDFSDSPGEVPGDPDAGPTEVPFDGGVYLLLAVGLTYRLIIRFKRKGNTA